MDNQSHTFSGHDGNEQYELNFILSLFIQYGMPVRRDQTSKAFEKDLHPSKRGYLQRHVDLLHSLTILCRDALRRHFTGHQVHKYMDSVNIPTRLKDSILLKGVLLQR